MNPAQRPALRVVFARQIHEVAANTWPELAVFVCVFATECAVLAARVHGTPVHSYADRQLGLHSLVLVGAACWPLAVWRGLAPRQRRDLEALPIARRTAIACRTGAGLVLLFAAWGVANIAGLAVGAVAGRGQEFAAVSVFAWLASALGATIVYLMASAIAVASDTPGRWILGLAVLVYAPPLFVPLPGFAVRPGPAWFWKGTLGFERAVRYAVTEAQLDTRLAEFRLDQWLPAALFWCATGAALVGLASRRRVDL